MLEQSTQNGAVYLSQEKIENGQMKLVTKSVVINRIKFGPPSSIIIHRSPRTTTILVEYPEENGNNGYIYNDNRLEKRIPAVTNADDDLLTYLYGIAIVDDEVVPYFIQNNPVVSITDVPDRDAFSLPPTVGGYPYDNVFTYDERIIALLGNAKATFVDRYKRPIHPVYMTRNRFFPTDLDTVNTTFGELVQTKQPFPLVVQLNNTSFGCLDLEPGYTEEEYDLATSFDAYYVEDTPNGGKHFLIRNTDEGYKYTLSENLEGITNTAITIYGLNGQWLNDNPDAVTFDAYTEVGTAQTQFEINENRPAGLDTVVADVTHAIDQMGSTGKRRALRAYKTSDDESWCDFTALSRLYRFDILPFKSSIPEEMLPWVLSEYGASIIPSRMKHQSNRNGVPYLTYLAHKIIYS